MGLWQTGGKEQQTATPLFVTSPLPNAPESRKSYLSSQAGHGHNRTLPIPHTLPGGTHTHPYLLVLIGGHGYELGFREGAVHDHPVGAPHTHYVDLGLIFMQRVQHNLLRRKHRKTRRAQPGLAQVMDPLALGSPQLSTTIRAALWGSSATCGATTPL